MRMRMRKFKVRKPPADPLSERCQRAVKVKLNGMSL